MVNKHYSWNEVIKKLTRRKNTMVTKNFFWGMSVFQMQGNWNINQQSCLFWLYVIIMLCRRFRVNLHSIVVWIWRWNRCYIWSLSDSKGIETHNHLFHKLQISHLFQVRSSFYRMPSSFIECLEYLLDLVYETFDNMQPSFWWDKFCSTLPKYWSVITNWR